MTRKFLVSLTPLLAVAAFVVLPATAQGVPHLYQNKVIVTEGKRVRDFGWGNFKFTNGSRGEIECRNVFAGYLENPAGGGAARGKTEAWDTFECVDPTCAALGGTGEVIPEKKPWSVETKEPESGAFTVKTGETNGPTSIYFTLKCGSERIVLEGGLTANYQAPQNEAIGYPAYLKYDQPGAGELESEHLGGFQVSSPGGQKQAFEGYTAFEKLELSAVGF